jgi:hypothetical protein
MLPYCYDLLQILQVIFYCRNNFVATNYKGGITKFKVLLI